MAGILEFIAKKNLAKQQALDAAARSGEFIPRSNQLTNFNDQVNTNTRPDIEGSLEQQPSGLLDAPQGAIGAPQPQGLLNAPNPSDIDPKTGFPYGKAAGVGGVIAGGGLLASMDSGEGSANANPNLTPEQIKADQDGQAQMQKDAQDIKSGAATPEQLLRATNFQQREAAAAGNEIQEIAKPEGIEQGFWDKLGGQFDMTSVGLALMASSGNGQPLGANLGKALQVGVMSAESKRALSGAGAEKARLEAKKDKIRTDALASADTKYTATLAQQDKVNARELRKVAVLEANAKTASRAAENKRNKAIATANKVSTKTPQLNEMWEVAALAETTEGLGFKIDPKKSEGSQIATNVIYAARANLPETATPQEKQAELVRQLQIRFEKDGGFAYFDKVDVNPINTQTNNTQTINGVNITRN
jgi:hypothetical protein